MIRTVDAIHPSPHQSDILFSEHQSEKRCANGENNPKKALRRSIPHELSNLSMAAKVTSSRFFLLLKRLLTNAVWFSMIRAIRKAGAKEGFR